MAKYKQVLLGTSLGVFVGCSLTSLYYHHNHSQIPDQTKDERPEKVFPAWLPTSPDWLLSKPHFHISYNSQTKNANWVAQHLTQQSLEQDQSNSRAILKNSLHFVQDHDVPLPFRTKVSDFTLTGFDRGHLAPCADFIDKQESFVLTNVSPQVPNFNRGYWKELEFFVRKLTTTFDDVFVITGPLYLSKYNEAEKRFFVHYETLSDDLIAVPTHFYKIIQAKTNDGHSYTASFVLPNQNIDHDVVLSDFIVPIEAIEKSSGLLFFPNQKKNTGKDLCKIIECKLNTKFKSKINEVQKNETTLKNDV